MKRLTNLLKSLALVALLIALLFISLPQINLNIGDSSYKYNLADELLKPQGIGFTDFKKGSGLYSTNVVTASFSEDTTFETVNSAYQIIVNRIKTALLTDIKASISQVDNLYSIKFEFPNYYVNPSQYVQWLTAKADIYFATAEETPQILDLNDYDISGEIKNEYSINYKDHLSFYFSTDKQNLVSSYLSSSQYFLMYIDGTPAMYVLDFDNYLDTNLGRVRAVSILSMSSSSEREIIDYINIVKSYFNSSELPVVLNTDSVLQEIPATSKYASLSVIALVMFLLTILPSLLLSPTLNLGIIYKRLVWSLVFGLLFVGFLKFFGAILNLDLLVGYISTLLIVHMFIINWGNIKSPRKVLLALTLVFGFITKFHFINYSIGSIGGTVVVGLIAFILSTYYLPLIDFVKLIAKFILYKIKNIRFKRK